MEQQHAEPRTVAPSSKETAYYDARTLEGLAQAERGEGITMSEARDRMETFIAEHRS